MRIAVTGATGLIGRTIVTRLLARGDQVVALTRDPVRTAGHVPAGVAVAEWNQDDTAPTAKAISGCDAVVHLAGEPVMAKRWNRRVLAEIRRSRVDGTRSIVRAIEDADPRPAVLASASAVGYYAFHEDSEVDEGAPPGHHFLAEVCLSWEAEAERARALGLRVAVVRIGIVLSRAGGALPRMVTPFRFFLGGPVGSGRQGFPWIHERDVAGLFLHAVDGDGISGPLNAVAPQLVTNREFCRALGKALRRPSWLPAPAFALRLFVGRASEIILNGQRPIPRRTIESGYAFAFPDLAAALGDLFKREP